MKKINKNIYHLFLALLIKDGNRFKAQSILINVLENLKKKTNKIPLEVFNEAIENISPLLKLKKKKYKRKTFKIPTMCQKKYYNLGIKNLLICIATHNKYKKNTLENALTCEILDAYHSKGLAYNQKILLHRTVIENKSNLKFL